MSGRSRWWGRLSSIICIATAAGCSQLPLPPFDGGTGDMAPPMTFGPRPLTPVQVDAVALAADDSGIYWTSPANEVWVLPAGSPVPLPLPLARDTRIATTCPGPTPTPPVLTASHAFWFDSSRVTLHRTRKDGGGDDELAVVNRADHLAADGGAVYWIESAWGYVDGYTDGSVIRSLPQEATPGSSPTMLLVLIDAISSMTVVSGTAYWTPYPNATMYDSDVWSAPVAALAQGEAGTKLAGPLNPYALTGAGADLLFGFYPDRFTTGLARRRPSDSDPEMIGTLPSTDSFLTGLAATGGWLLASTYTGSYGCGQPLALNLYAAPLAGGAPKLIAVGMRTPAIAAPQGIVFVDADRHLVALPADQIAGIVSPVP